MSGTSSFTPYISPVVRQFEPYVAGRSIAEIKEAFGLERVIKLASNENPLGCPPSVQQLLRDQAALAFRYPQAGNPRLVRAIAAHHGVDPARVITSDGSDEVIDLLFRVCAKPGVDNVVAFKPCFGIYTTQAAFAGVELRQTPLKADFSMDFDALLKLVDEHTAMVFVTSPDNPSGRATPRETLIRLADALPERCMLVVDEAYIDFVRAERGGEAAFTMIPVLDKHPNVAVVRTFSKSRGMAGVRLGYGILPGDLALYLWRVRLPFSVSLLAEEAGIVAIEDAAFHAETLRVVEEGRRQLETGLAALGCEVTPSDANFLCFCHPRMEKAAGVCDALLRKGIIVRGLASYHLPSHIRVSVGTAEENAMFLAALAEVLPGARD